ncbi:MAG: YjjW family glycine radical enzyme activase [Lachnospiraceae bacterium]|nr:YjjW family glycine radical enzyme activase [Lachnospiraceae bacterium]
MNNRLDAVTAPVNKIIRFSSVDGPGNRTAIFLQGCNFDCRYCHNPETRRFCIGCGKCVKTCPAGALSQTPEGQVRFDPAKCVSCDTCIKVCEHDASPRICEMTAEDVMKEVRWQQPYIRGITVSGGECSLHPRFLKELFEIAQKEALTCFLDSNGSYDFSKDPELMAVTDSVMLDIKAFSPEDHLNTTGAGNKTVLANAKYLAEIGKLFEIRTVVAPDLFDVTETVRCAGEMLLPYLQKGAKIRYKLITYRPMGVREKYRNMRIPTEEEMMGLKMLLTDMGWDDVVIT